MKLEIIIIVQDGEGNTIIEKVAKSYQDAHTELNLLEMKLVKELETLKQFLARKEIEEYAE